MEYAAVNSAALVSSWSTTNSWEPWRLLTKSLGNKHVQTYVEFKYSFLVGKVTHGFVVPSPRVGRPPCRYHGNKNPGYAILYRLKPNNDHKRKIIVPRFHRQPYPS